MKHKHAEFIKAWADGAEIQTYHKSTSEWADTDTPYWELDREYRIKPKQIVPETRMTPQQLKRAFHAANGETQKGWRGIANAAIARAIADGDVKVVEKNYVDQLSFTVVDTATKPL